jgi:hypothetical protein
MQSITPTKAIRIRQEHANGATITELAERYKLRPEKVADLLFNRSTKVRPITGISRAIGRGQ